MPRNTWLFPGTLVNVTIVQTTGEIYKDIVKSIKRLARTNAFCAIKVSTFICNLKDTEPSQNAWQRHLNDFLTGIKCDNV